MQRVNQLRQSFQLIVSSNYPNKIKRLMLEAVKQELLLLDAIIKVQNASFSEFNSFKIVSTETTNSATSHLSICSNQDNFHNRILSNSLRDWSGSQDLQTKIIEKQCQKRDLNEDIQAYEDDYFQMQKILLTKKDYNQQLDNLISRRSYQISKQSIQKCVIISRQQEKKSLSSRLKHFFLP